MALYCLTARRGNPSWNTWAPFSPTGLANRWGTAYVWIIASAFYQDRFDHSSSCHNRLHSGPRAKAEAFHEPSGPTGEWKRSSGNRQPCLRSYDTYLHFILLTQRLQLPLRPRSCHQHVQLPHYQREELCTGNLLRLPGAPRPRITACQCTPCWLLLHANVMGPSVWRLSVHRNWISFCLVEAVILNSGKGKGVWVLKGSKEKEEQTGEGESSKIKIPCRKMRNSKWFLLWGSVTEKLGNGLACLSRTEHEKNRRDTCYTQHRKPRSTIGSREGASHSELP